MAQSIEPLFGELVELLCTDISSKKFQENKEKILPLTYPVSIHDLRTLSPTIIYENSWLTGDTINSYLGLLSAKFPQCINVNSGLATIIAKGINHDKYDLKTVFGKLTREELVTKIHFIPVSVSNHWILVAIFPPMKIVEVIESLNHGAAYFKKANNIIQWYNKEKLLEEPCYPLARDEAKMDNESRHCGVYLLWKAKQMAEVGIRSLPFSYQDLRLRMTVELLLGKLFNGDQVLPADAGSKLLERLTNLDNKEEFKGLLLDTKPFRFLPSDLEDAMAIRDKYGYDPVVMRFCKKNIRILKDYLRQVAALAPSGKSSVSATRTMNAPPSGESTAPIVVEDIKSAGQSKLESQKSVTRSSARTVSSEKITPVILGGDEDITQQLQAVNSTTSSTAELVSDGDKALVSIQPNPPVLTSKNAQLELNSSRASVASPPRKKKKNNSSSLTPDEFFTRDKYGLSLEDWDEPDFQTELEYEKMIFYNSPIGPDKNKCHLSEEELVTRRLLAYEWSVDQGHIKSAKTNLNKSRTGRKKAGEENKPPAVVYPQAAKEGFTKNYMMKL